MEDAAIERERQVILREMAEVNKNQEELVLDHLHATAFQGCSLGRTILGSEENIRSLTRDDLQQYIKTNYTAPRMVLAGAGAVDHSQLVELADKHFGSLPSSSPAGGGVDVAMEPAVFTGSDYRYVHVESLSRCLVVVVVCATHSPPILFFRHHLHQTNKTNTKTTKNKQTNNNNNYSVKFNSEDVAHMAVAFPTASWTSEYAFPLMLMQIMLGSYDRAHGMGKNHASNLCQDVAENELAYSLNTFNTCYKDTGLFGIYAVVPDNKVDDMSWTIMNNLIRLVHTPSDAEVERAKVSLKAAMLMNMDGHNNVAEEIGRSLLNYGRRMTPAELFARIDAVTTSDIRATAYKFFNDQDHCLAAVGGIHELPDYTWFRRHTYWLRY